MKNNILNLLPYFFVLIGIVFALSLISHSLKITQENNFYTRFQACVLSISPSVRSKVTINSCYDQVEQQTGVKAMRYQVDGFK
jgi:hypothetical protein